METDRISTFSETKEGINMANKKSLESIYNEIEMLTAKIKSYNERLKKLEREKTEMENLQIVEKVRAVYLTREELRQFFKSGCIPEAEENEATEQEAK